MGEHGASGVFNVAAREATPAHEARFFPRFQPQDNCVEPVAHLLQHLTQRDDELVLGHRSSLAGASARLQKSGAARRRFDVERQVELLLALAASKKTTEEAAQVSHPRSAIFPSAWICRYLPQRGDIVV